MSSSFNAYHLRPLFGLVEKGLAAIFWPPKLHHARSAGRRTAESDYRGKLYCPLSSAIAQVRHTDSLADGKAMLGCSLVSRRRSFVCRSGPPVAFVTTSTPSLRRNGAWHLMLKEKLVSQSS